MNKILISFFLFGIMYCPITVKNMPGTSEEEEETPEQEKPKTAKPTTPEQNKTPSTPKDNTVTKPKPLSWPYTVEISEDNKTLLEVNNKKIVQLFTESQALCKNMDDTLSRLNQERDAANKSWRQVLMNFEPLLQRIGAAQAKIKDKEKK